MAKSPDCDFWMYERLPDGRVIEIERDSNSLYEADLRRERYDLDVERWSREWYWTARQAALISFFRDPKKVEDMYANNAICGVPETAGLNEGHHALANSIDELQTRIADAQREGQLPDFFFPPSKYLDWARRVGVDFPEPVWRAVQQFELWIKDRAKNHGPILDDRSQEDFSQDDTGPMNPKTHGPAAKPEKTLKKIILAFIVRSQNQIDVKASKAKVENMDDFNGLADKLAAVLTELDSIGEEGGNKLTVSKRTINDYLSSARDLLT